MRMRVINDFDYAVIDGTERYTMETGTGTARIDHRQFPFGVSVNRNDIRSEGFSNRDRIGDMNMVGINICLLGSADCIVGTRMSRIIPGAGMIGRPSAELNTLSFPARRYRGISIGFTPSEMDMPLAGRTSEAMVSAIAGRIGGVALFECSPDVLAAAHGIDIAMDRGGGEMEEAVRELSGFLLRSLYGSIGAPSSAVPSGRHDALVDSVCVDMMEKGMGLNASCSRHGADPTLVIRWFAERYGDTPSSFVRSHRLSKAAGHILAGDEVMKDVATEAGYSSESKFAISFRKMYGIRPKHYLQSSLGRNLRA